jgi:hypothetical protein
MEGNTIQIDMKHSDKEDITRLPIFITTNNDLWSWTMASRQLRSRRAGELSASETDKLPNAQIWDYGEETNDALDQNEIAETSREMVVEGTVVGGTSEVEIINQGPTNKVQTEQTQQSDLLNIILQSMKERDMKYEQYRLKEREERLAKEQKQEAIRQKEMEEDRYRLDQVREDIMKTSNNNAVQG